MVYKRFYIQLIIRTTLIFLNIFWLSFIILQPFQLYTFITSLILLLIQFFLFIYYINNTNRELSRFFTSLKDEFSSMKMSTERKASFKVLSDILNETQEIIRTARLEKEKQFHFLEFIIQNLNYGIAVFDESGKTIQYNNSLLHILSRDTFRELKVFEELRKGLYDRIRQMSAGGSEVMRFFISGKLKIILLQKHIMKFEDQEMMLLSIQDFRKEIETNELESWKKLIRVLNHEVMNSITPISTLTHASERSLEKLENKGSEEYLDILQNLKSIEKRSKGLVEFVNKYRSLTKPPEVNPEKISIKKMLEHIIVLFKEEMDGSGILTEINVEPIDIEIYADANLIEQVIINILKNAMESFEKETGNLIEFNVFNDKQNKAIIELKDNGQGIPEENFDDIFTPFFTTRKGGSGIGLSLSRQIMRLHGGTMDISSQKGRGTKVELKF